MQISILDATKQEKKLIAALEEYIARYNEKCCDFTLIVHGVPWITIFWIHESIIISKDFQFIEWLVSEKKIDREKRADSLYWNIILKFDMREEFWDVLVLLMLLSISQNPLWFLSDIMK